jgi:hypothetical protein
MSLDYYIKLKYQNDHLKYSVEEIITNYDEMICLAENKKEIYKNNKNNRSEIITIDNDLNYFFNMKNKYLSHLEEIKREKENIIKNIYELCDHDFIEDTIDIDPDRCKYITYCKICGLIQK